MKREPEPFDYQPKGPTWTVILIKTMLANGIISLYSEGSDTPYTNSVEFLLGGISPTVFKDGTRQFMAGYAEDIRVYSPRLLPVALEKFCEENISRYENFHGEHGVDKLINEGTPLESFW